MKRQFAIRFLTMLVPVTLFPLSMGYWYQLFRLGD